MCLFFLLMSYTFQNHTFNVVVQSNQFCSPYRSYSLLYIILFHCLGGLWCLFKLSYMSLPSYWINVVASCSNKFEILVETETSWILSWVVDDVQIYGATVSFLFQHKHRCVRQTRWLPIIFENVAKQGGSPSPVIMPQFARMCYTLFMVHQQRQAQQNNKGLVAKFMLYNVGDEVNLVLKDVY